jgi:Na+/H+ antiporter NhaC
MTTEHDTDAHQDMEGAFQLGSRLGKAVLKGIVIALPIAYVGLVIGLMLLTGRGFRNALETAILPGLLIGVFFGGFAGMAVTLIAVERLEKEAKKSRRSNG